METFKIEKSLCIDLQRLFLYTSLSTLQRFIDFLYIEPEIHNISISHYIVLPFDS
jgi:hypothetical protein